MGSSVVNCVMDGLEKIIRSTYKPFKADKYKRSKESIAIILKYNKDIKKIKKNVPIRFLYLRFADNILIIGKTQTITLPKVMNVLEKELKSKGLTIKNKDNFHFWFKPGACFDYLGFRFIYPNFKEKKLNKRKYILNKYVDLSSVVRGSILGKDDSRLLVLVNPNSFKECRNKIRHILDRSNSGMSVNELIQRYNSTLRGIIYYFGITQTTRTQLRYLNNLGYR